MKISQEYCVTEGSKEGLALTSKVGGGSRIDRMISNVPLTITSLSLALVSLGSTLHTLSSFFLSHPTLTFTWLTPSFANVLTYTASYIDRVCISLASVLLLLFFSKLLLAPVLISDELSRVHSASPAGCLLMTMSLLAFRIHSNNLVYASSATHLLLVLWFLFAATKGRILPDPSWWPNTVGIGLAAGKLAKISPYLASSLLLVSSTLFLLLFPISLFRVYNDRTNKIPLTVCWIQLSAPAVLTVAVLSIKSPESRPSARPIIDSLAYCLLALMMVSVASVSHATYRKYPKFKQSNFTPAHAAFCFPTCAHFAGISAFHGYLSTSHPGMVGGKFERCVFFYMAFTAVAATFVTGTIVFLYVRSLRSWVDIRLELERVGETFDDEGSFGDSRGTTTTVFFTPSPYGSRNRRISLGTLTPDNVEMKADDAMPLVVVSCPSRENGGGDRNMLVRSNFLSPHDGFRPDYEGLVRSDVWEEREERVRMGVGKEVEIIMGRQRVSGRRRATTGDSTEVWCDTPEEAGRIIEREIEDSPDRRVWGMLGVAPAEMFRRGGSGGVSTQEQGMECIQERVARSVSFRSRGERREGEGDGVEVEVTEL